MKGVVDADIVLRKGMKVFVFQTDPARRNQGSPTSTIVIGFEDDQVPEQVPAPAPALVPEPEPEVVVEDQPVYEPEPVPDDDGDCPF
jgi:hypothetical protein